ncbi:MAG: AraC family transcriptional regulator [Firmicutes bacterium]|nr:AraC family transcriptional regulator [Bacillota bacterium]MDY3716346.1 AraC family transcriptional regulator [Blautia sp.]
MSRLSTSCGFNHLSYFSKIFMKKYGCTPSDFRNSCATDRA